jgi:hypothetical protein
MPFLICLIDSFILAVAFLLPFFDVTIYIPFAVDIGAFEWIPLESSDWFISFIKVLNNTFRSSLLNILV